jgi:hypothetical protein
MATRTISYHTLVCDGCEKPFGRDTHYASVIEARAAAYGEGWRFPERYKVSGGESKSVNDVCPACEPTWERKPAQNNWTGRRGRGGESR